MRLSARLINQLAVTAMKKTMRECIRKTIVCAQLHAQLLRSATIPNTLSVPASSLSVHRIQALKAQRVSNNRVAAFGTLDPSH